jgi:hypothetical protein
MARTVMVSRIPLGSVVRDESSSYDPIIVEQPIGRLDSGEP